MRLILKTTVATDSEIPWLWMKFHEAAPFADEIVVCEFDTTLSGLPKPFAFEKYVDEFLTVFPNLVYLQGKKIPGLILDAQDTVATRSNETHFRGWFARQLPFKSDDIIVSTDADEVLYQDTYSWITRTFSRKTKGVRFGLHQVFYRPNFYWVDKKFMAPVALRFGAYDKVYPNNWRNQGQKLDGFWGMHFSWCMPIEEMMVKVKSYGHAPEHQHVDSRKVFEDAISSKTFPFDDRDFHLEEIAFNSPLLPDSFMRFAHLISPEVLGEFQLNL